MSGLPKLSATDTPVTTLMELLSITGSARITDGAKQRLLRNHPWLAAFGVI